MKSISPDLLDLFDENDNSENNGTRILVEMCRASKKRRRRLLKSVKDFQGSERSMHKRNRKKKRYTHSIDTAKQDISD